MSECIFCKIVNNEIPSEKIYEDEKIIGFKDLSPQSKEHYLFISKKHTQNINEFSQDTDELSSLFSAIKTFTEKETNLAQTGFRIVTNQGEQGGQTVFHTHFHVLGGEKLGLFGK